MLSLSSISTYRCPLPSVTACSGAPPKSIVPAIDPSAALIRSEEHTSELLSRLHLVCRLLLEKKKRRNGGAASRPATGSALRRRWWRGLRVAPGPRGAGIRSFGVGRRLTRAHPE